jgi:hypothetical protein
VLWVSPFHPLHLFQHPLSLCEIPASDRYGAWRRLSTIKSVALDLSVPKLPEASSLSDSASTQHSSPHNLQNTFLRQPILKSPAWLSFQTAVTGKDIFHVFYLFLKLFLPAHINKNTIKIISEDVYTFIETLKGRFLPILFSKIQFLPCSKHIGYYLDIRTDHVVIYIPRRTNKCIWLIPFNHTIQPCASICFGSLLPSSGNSCVPLKLLLWCRMVKVKSVY